MHTLVYGFSIQEEKYEEEKIQQNEDKPKKREKKHVTTEREREYTHAHPTVGH